MHEIEKVLSPRLRVILDMVPADRDVADIGCDHAYLAIALSEANPERRVFAMDVRKGPLERAQENVKKYEAEASVELRLSDGFAALRPGETGAAVLAGMGGPLMEKLLLAGEKLFAEGYTLILSPQSEPESVRGFLAEHGFVIEREAIVTEEGKFYPVILAVKDTDHPVSEEPLLRVHLRYGEKLLMNPDPLVDRFLEKEEAEIRGLLQKLGASAECGGIPAKEQAGDPLEQVSAEGVKRRIFELQQELQDVLLAKELRGVSGRKIDSGEHIS